jgi:hypothetical protein
MEPPLSLSEHEPEQENEAEQEQPPEQPHEEPEPEQQNHIRMPAPPGVISNPCLLLALPRELRDEI